MTSFTQQLKSTNSFVVQTNTNNWVIPHNCELLKALLEHQQLSAADLTFNSNNECKNFIKKIFLLALEDETQNQSPSTLAKFGRDLIKIQRFIV